MKDLCKLVKPMLTLEKILGITALSNASITAGSRSSDIYYAAGSVLVRYNPDENIQKSFYKASKAVSCAAISPDGKYLAVGERGHSPNIMVWEISSGELKSTISGTHKYGIGCLTFSADSRYLVSAGFKHDRQLIIWEWATLRIASTQKLGNKVNSICFHPGGNYFVTCGDRHLKWWYLLFDDNGIGTIEVTGKPASILESHKNAVFMDVKIGMNGFVYCNTSTGLLCAFNETRFMDMWVQLESAASYSISLHTFPSGSIGNLDVVIVGCTEGMIRVFSAKSLQYLVTLPLPVPSIGDTENFPACLAICTINGTKTNRQSRSPKLAAIYSDNSLYIWDIGDINNAFQYRSFTYHRACIWDVQFISSTTSGRKNLFSPGTFVTCSADNSIRIWNGDPKPEKRSGSVTSKSTATPRLQHGDMLHLIEVAPKSGVEAIEGDNNGSSSSNNNNSNSNNRNSINQSVSSFSVSSSLATTVADITTNTTSALSDLGSGIPDLELPIRPQVAMAPRSLAVHPSGKQLVCGDRSGLLRVFDLVTMTQIHSTQAHAGEVLTLHYSPPIRPLSDGTWTVDFVHSLNGEEEDEIKEDSSSLVLLASAGRDRLVHVFNASKGYKPMSTLNNHSSAVTVVRFTPDGTRLLSCGGDRTMVFNSVRGTDITLLKSVQTPHGTINGLAIEATNKFAITSGQDRRLNIWNLQSGKHMRAYKNDAVTGELYKSDVDPSGIFVASCAFDKTINLFDFFSGDLVAQVTGHSELITSVRFSPDGRYLLSVGGDGCIMIWSLAEPLVSAMQERLLELISSAIKRQKQSILNEEKAKPTKNSRSSSSSPDILSSPVPPTTVSSSSIMPPPPPSNIQMSQPQSQLRMKSSSSSSAAAAAAPSSSSLITDNIRSEIRKSIAGSVGASVASGRGNRWASRAEQQGGYELFGRKMSSIPNPEKHKLTLELTNFDEIDSRDEMKGDGKGKSEIGENIKNSNSHSYDNEINDDSLNSNDNTDNNNENDNDYRNEKEIYHGNKLANTLEASDDVMAFEDSGSDDDHENDQSSNLKKKMIQQSSDRNEKGTNENYDDYEDDFEKNDETNNSCNIDDDDNDNDDDIGTRNQNKGKNKNSTDYGSEAYLDKASKGIDILEQSAINLESWLENMIRNGSPSERNNKEKNSNTDSNSDEQQPTLVSDGRALLSESLSSLFFKNLKIPNEDQNVKKEIKSKKNAAAETHDKKTSYLPLPPSRGPLKDSNTPVKINDVTPPSSKEKSQKTLDPVDSEIREIKRKETAAAVASMKDKLRNMGMLGRTGETGRKVDLSGRKKREGSAYKEKSSEITNEIDNEMKHKRDVDEGEEEEEEEEEGEETDTDSDNNDDEYEQDNVDVEDADGVQDSSRTINTNISVQPTGGASTQYKNEIFTPPPPPTELERKRENMMEIEELSFDNKDDSLNYEEEYSEDYGSIQGTIQFNNNSLFSKPSISDASDTVVRDRVEEVEKGGVENMFFESELETAPESEISKNRVKKQEIFTADLGLSPSDTSSGKEDNRSEEGSSGNNFKKEEDSSENDINENDVENENENDIGKREEYLYKLYLDQEKMLSIKSAQCKHIISELNRAKLAAQSSFAELATLRSNLNDTILSSSSHLKSFSKLPIQSNLIEPSGLLRNEKNGNQLENLTASVTSSVFISGLYLSSPGRGRTLDSTTDILQGSVIIAEADALLTEFRDSFSISTSISTFIPPSNSLSIPISRIAHSQNLSRDREKKNYGVTSSGRRSIQTRTTQNNDSSDGNNISASTFGLTDSHMSEVEVEVEDGDESSTTQSPRAKKADSLDEMEMINFLEKYSDRLVEMVSNKVIAKTQALNEK